MFQYGQIIEYIDATYDENFNAAYEWCKENNATLDELIDKRKEVDNELHRFFQINEIPKPIVPEPEPTPEPTLEELKLVKRAEINQARDNAEQGGFEYMGKVFDSDLVSCVRISSAAQAMSTVAMSGETPTITWTCQDNSTIDLTAPELMGLVVALAQWSNTCHEKATSLKAQIDACESKEELDKIVWE